MREYKGKSIYADIAIGEVLIINKTEQLIKRTKIDNVSEEINRYEKAKDASIKQLDELYNEALIKVGEEHATIFEVHKMMLQDDDYNDSIKNIITTDFLNAEYAVAITSDNFYKMFNDMEDDYFRARATDIKDISDRVIRALTNKTNSYKIEKPSIIVANDLTPSETVAMDKDKVLAFITEQGSANSHTAILARTMGIPALIGIKIDESWNGKNAIVDGFEGTLVIEPDEKTLDISFTRKNQLEENRKELLSLKDKEAITKDGRKIMLFANIGNTSELESVLANGGEGIGLFRSEFIYLGRNSLPTEEEQFYEYKMAAEKMLGKNVIIRTLDIGADKQVDYLGLSKEENPALGYRAIRICLKRQDVFKTQLRALYRASAYGKISIMYPLITSVEEVLKIKEIVEEVKRELTEANITFGEVEQGIMIETPAAVMISDELAKHVDFFSIGTNDLTQYTLAIDRQNPDLEDFYNPHHKAILKMIEMVIKNGHENNCYVGICGELGSDLDLTEQLIKMGIDEISVTPTYLLDVKKKIREIGL